MSKLFAGPWVGEFGWELMMWQGHIRTIAEKYDEIIVSARPGHDYFYSDFCTEFVPHKEIGQTDMELCNNRINATFPNSWKEKGYDIYLPRRFPRLKSGPNGKIFNSQTFIQYGEPQPELHYDVVIHARSTDKCRTGYRNWPVTNWKELVQRLAGLKICTIGAPDGAMAIPGVTDLRGQSIKDTCNLLASSECVVGPSSGPMHLASLCGCTHIVLTDPCNRSRYESEWNPLSTTAIVVDEEGWTPSVDRVYGAIRGAI